MPNIHVTIRFSVMLAIAALLPVLLNSCGSSVHIPAGTAFNSAEPLRYSYTGTWQTNYGTLYMTQNGSAVSGTGSHILSGTISGSRLQGNYSYMFIPGSMYFVMSGDGNFIRGAWGSPAPIDEANVRVGRREGAPVPVAGTTRPAKQPGPQIIYRDRPVYRDRTVEKKPDWR